jgi:hypothetical protein
VLLIVVIVVVIVVAAAVPCVPNVPDVPCVPEDHPGDGNGSVVAQSCLASPKKFQKKRKTRSIKKNLWKSMKNRRKINF